MAKPPGKCVFCGNGGLTKEHVWSDWLKQIIPRDWDRYEQYAADVHNPDPATDKPRHKKQGAVHSRQARIVCGACNSGWMGDIVEAAKPVAQKLILGERFLLTKVPQAHLSPWIALSALIADKLTRAEWKLPPCDYQYMYEHHQPPPHWHIGIGFYSGAEPVAFNNRVMPIGSEDTSGERIVKFTLHTKTSILGHLYSIVDVLVTREAEAPPFRGDAYLPYITRIFPTPFDAIRWPPAPYLAITGTMNPGDGLASELATIYSDKLYAGFVKKGLVRRPPTGRTK